MFGFTPNKIGWTSGRDRRQISPWILDISHRFLFFGLLFLRHEQNWTVVFPVNTSFFFLYIYIYIYTHIYIYISHHILPISHHFPSFPIISNHFPQIFSIPTCQTMPDRGGAFCRAAGGGRLAGFIPRGRWFLWGWKHGMNQQKLRLKSPWSMVKMVDTR